MTDPLEPSAEWQARQDQARAAIRDLSGQLRTAVAELVADGWTEEQARVFVVAVLRHAR